MSDVDYDTMSDEDFLKLEASLPASTAEAGSDEGTPLSQEAEDTSVAAGSAPVVDHTTPNHTEPDTGSTSAAADTAIPAPAAGQDPVSQAVADGSKADAPAATQEPAAAAVDYEAEYRKIMAPFKANGHEFTPSSVEDVMRLAQMGANYTKKMQALKPNLKLMRMLDNNGLLDESKLSYLIDLSNKNPAAIQKLVADSKIDPLDLNTTASQDYRPSNHSISDQEMAFHEALADVNAAPGGNDTVRLINGQWDAASKDAVYREPALLGIIHEQRANGIYDRISAEIERQRMLGNLQNVPFIQAYKQVGDILNAQGALGQRASAAPITPAPASQPRVLETRAAQPRSQSLNGDAARAASAPARSAPKPSNKVFDVFAMSDEEIMAIPNPGAN